ncbi:hypothetical protein [Mycoplasma buteonis]|uniref:hypothetical protein n=1 Tax=Mycoplasma buteonis TaxID=171280 RepID=UPI0012EBADF6|nr:hypothetical protein [Mycoplasma buteonis]
MKRSRKWISWIGLSVPVGLVASFYIYQSWKEENPKFSHFNKNNNLLSYNLLHDIHTNILSSSDLEGFGSFSDNSYRVSRYPSDVKTIQDVDNFYKFEDKNFYTNFVLVGREVFDEIGVLVLYFERRENFSQKNIEKLNPNNMHKVILNGFRKKDISSKKPETTINAATEVNNIGFYYQNSDKTEIGNGNFFNFIKTNDNSYPRKWFLITAGHTLYDAFDKESFNLNLFNTDVNIKVQAKVVQDGRNQWDYDLTLLTKNLPDNLKEKGISPYLDYAILEIDFQNEDDAKKVTSTNIKDNIFYQIYGFKKPTGFYDIEEEKSVYKYIESSNRYNYKYSKYFSEPTSANSEIYSYLEVPYLKNEKVFILNDKLYIDLSYYEIFTDTKLGLGSSGIAVNADITPYIKIAENKNNGLWMPFLNTNKLRESYETILNFLFNDNVSNTYIDLGYNILFEDKYAANQSKSFEKTFQNLYPNSELGFSKEKLLINIDKKEYTIQININDLLKTIANK